MSIIPLPQHVITQICSANLINNLNEVVIELFKNSLDACSSKVEINVDYTRGTCVIEDNGKGILPSEFQEAGGLGRAYHTSKKHDSSELVHGSRGNFLASISNIALVIITSRHHLYRSHNTLTVNNSTIISRQLPSPPQHHLKFESGTRVTVNNLFGNIPVRVKQRAMNKLEQRIFLKEWGELVMGLLRTLLPWTKTQIEIMIRDKFSNHKIVLQTPNQLVGEVKVTPKICSILHQASIITAEDMMSWISVEASTKSFMITGTVSLRPFISKKCQFLSFGIKSISPEGSILHNEINNLFSCSSFGNVETNARMEEKEIQRREKDRRYKGSGYTYKELKSVKGIEKWPKFYFKIIPLAISEELSVLGADQNFWQTPSASLDNIRELMRELIYHFLKDNKFCTRSLCQKKLEKQSILEMPVTKPQGHKKYINSISKRQLDSISSVSNQQNRKTHNQFGASVKLPCFRQNTQSSMLSSGSFSKVKTGAIIRTSSESKLRNTSNLNGKTISTQLCNTVPHNIDVCEQRSFEDLASIDHETRQSLLNECEVACHSLKNTLDICKTSSHFLSKDLSCHFRSITPVKSSAIQQKTVGNHSKSLCMSSLTKKKSNENQQTGFITTALKFDLDCPTQDIFRSTISTKCSENNPNSWISQLLRSWNCPIYLPAEPKIPQLSMKCRNFVKDFPFGLSQSHAENDYDIRFDETASRLNNRISKQALRKAKFISQVDKKFILVKLPIEDCDKVPQKSDEMLVVIDQHAADERVRIESLLKDLCEPVKTTLSNVTNQTKSHKLTNPLIFKFPLDEIELLYTYQHHFSSWGIFYELPEKKNSTSSISTSQVVSINSLPPVISERCQQQPHLLTSLLRKEIWKLEESKSDITTELTTTAVWTSWLDRIHSCPAGILDLLNARACRSAIMFNDELSREQCLNLVQRLAECSFPFQCAHGRPSMVPLTRLSLLSF